MTVLTRSSKLDLRFFETFKKSLTFDPPHNANECCMTRQNSKSTQDANESSFKTWVSSFQKSPFFYIHHPKEFREMIYFSRKIAIAICTYSEGTDQQHLHVQFKANLSQVQFKFWGDKKWPMEGFILSWISIFISSVSFELSKLFNVFLKVCI